jgi:retron-type reverse transcriptase
MARTSGRAVISTRQEKLAELARIEPKLVLTTLAQHIDEVWLREAYRRTRKDGAAGVDGVTAAQYEAELEANLSSLLERFKSGRYRAPAVRRVHIPKPGTKKTRPIGIPTLEDKVLQRAVLMVLEPVYEQDFLDCSYGFRPGRSAHQALEALWRGLMRMGGGWIIDLDIQSFFDDVDWSHLRGFLDQRVRDGVIRRAIGKWLNAGVMESGEVTPPERGTPQGGVVSPLLSNLYLHEVLDMWFEHEVKPRLRGRALCRRRDLGLRAGGGCSAGAGGAGEAIGQVRSAPAPGEDPTGGLPSSAASRGRRLAARAQPRAAGVHTLLGMLQEGALGSQTQDGQASVQPRAARDRQLVSCQSPPQSARAAGGAE